MWSENGEKKRIWLIIFPSKKTDFNINIRLENRISMKIILSFNHAKKSILDL
jgi:hypothetical protein